MKECLLRYTIKLKPFKEKRIWKASFISGVLQQSGDIQLLITALHESHMAAIMKNITVLNYHALLLKAVLNI